MSTTLLLAAWLGRLEKDELTQVLRRRALPGGEIADVYDLTRALLTPDSVRRALVTLDRYALAAIAAVARSQVPLASVQILASLDEASGGAVDRPAVEEGLGIASSLALVIPDERGAWICPEQVVDELAGWPSRGLPGVDVLVVLAPPAVIEPIAVDDPTDRDRAAAERAFGTLDVLGGLLSTAQEAPITLLARGALPLPTARRLSEATNSDLGTIADVFQLAVAAELIRATDGRLAVTPGAAEWQARRAPQRWLAVATKWFETTPTSLRQVLASRPGAEWGPSLREYVRWLFPAGDDWLPQVVDEFRRVADELGVLVADSPSTFGALLLAGDTEAASASIAALLPAEGDRVYLLPDLSIVSPGPLQPDVERRLRRVAEPATRGLAPTFRLSTESLQSAFASGLSEDDIRALLTEVSLSGLPQPVDYLLAETARRHGTLRVSAAPAERAPSKTMLTSEDELLLSAIVADRTLAVLGLVRVSQTEATSRLTPDVVYWTLRDARHPAALDPGILAPLPPQRREPARRVVEAEDRVAAIVVRVLAARSAAREQPADDHLGLLQLAIKDRRPVRVTVQMPNGASGTYQLVPTAVVSGRVRGVDPAAQVERTLPLSNITAVDPV